MPLRLATSITRVATSRTWPTVPAAPLRSAAVSVCTESIDADVGALGLEHREHGVEVGLREHGDVQRSGRGAALQPLGAQPDLRRRLLAADVERACGPRPGAGRAPSSSASTCRCPASRRAARASPGRGRRRAAGRARRCRSAGAARGRRRRRAGARLGGARAARRGASRRRRARRARAGARSSASEFHSAQAGHCPCHLAASCPQAEQTKIVSGRGIRAERRRQPPTASSRLAPALDGAAPRRAPARRRRAGPRRPRSRR